MRIPKNLEPAKLGLTRRQHFFLSAWSNRIHKSSLDSYRLRVMNPVNIMREFIKMYEPHADDRDRKIVAEELLGILDKHPVLETSFPNYAALSDVVRLLTDALQHLRKNENKGASPFRSRDNLLQALIRDLSASLERNFLSDSFAWLMMKLFELPCVETEEQESQSYADIERVCGDILSVVHDGGFSLESLFGLYKMMSSEVERGIAGDAEQLPYNFQSRLERVREIMLAESKVYRVFFTVGGMPAPIALASGKYGEITLSEVAPIELQATLEKIVRTGDWKKKWEANNQRLFAWLDLPSRDARFAGMQAYGDIGQLLDLIRFEFDAKNLTLSTDFVTQDNEKPLLLAIPELIPNPKPVRSARDLGDFVSHLNAIADRDDAKAESRDRILAAFRFYRIGTDVRLFENKLVNWWTAVEYLTKGSKAGGSIGGAVEAAMLPCLGLTYISKHMAALRAAIDSLGIASGELPPISSDQEFYAAIKDQQKLATLLDRSRDEPYLWHHLERISKGLKSDSATASLLRNHEGRIRWQIQRIYRARCDVVHNAKSVVMIGLLCANLEYYLRTILSSMLVSFREIPTLLGPSEFFERKKYTYERLLIDLDPKEKGSQSSAALLVQLLAS